MNPEDQSEPTRADLLLRESLSMLTPLVGALIDSGVTFSQFSQALKQTFLEAARRELESQNKRITDSALSLLSGVHRKDVRTMVHLHPRDAGRMKAVSIASLVFSRWCLDSTYLDRDGQPLPLPLRTKSAAKGKAAVAAPSFEQLTRSISKDFHSRSVLDELLRLGLAELRGDQVHLQADSFVPRQGYEEMLLSISANTRDFLAATMANLRNLGGGGESPFIERSIFEDGLSDASVAEMRGLATSIWRQAVKQVYDLAAQRDAIDAGAAPAQRSMRMRMGVYFYAENQAPEPPDEAAPRDAGSGGAEAAKAGKR